MGLGPQPQQEHFQNGSMAVPLDLLASFIYIIHETSCNLYPHLCLETVFPALKLTQNFYLHYNINIFS